MTEQKMQQINTWLKKVNKNKKPEKLPPRAMVAASFLQRFSCCSVLYYFGTTSGLNAIKQVRIFPYFLVNLRRLVVLFFSHCLPPFPQAPAPALSSAALPTVRRKPLKGLLPVAPGCLY